MNKDEVNDYNLYLLVDGQLDNASRKILMDKINARPELQKKLSDASRLKELISLAYMKESSVSSPVKSRSSRIIPSLLVGFAASLIMVMGLTLGLIIQGHSDAPNLIVAITDSPTAASMPEDRGNFGIQNVRKFVLHVNFLDETQLDKALVETSSILKSYAAVGLPVQMELVFDLQAVRIFEPQHIGQARKIKALINTYKNLELYACSKSLGMILGDIEKPEEMSVFHTDRVVEEMISERIRQGWVYIKV